MAIEKTTFTETQAQEIAREVYEWLQANATEYFDSISTDSSYKVYCKIGDVNVLSFASSNDLPVKITIKNGNSYHSCNSNGITRFIEGVKTENGIYLRNSLGEEIFVSKNNIGSTVFAAIIKSDNTTSAPYRIHFADFNGYAAIVSGNRALASLKNERAISVGGTSLSHMIFDIGTYAPGLFLTPFTESPEYIGKIVYDGVNYWYNGVFALKE